MTENLWPTVVGGMSPSAEIHRVLLFCRARLAQDDHAVAAIDKALAALASTGERRDNGIGTAS